MIEFIAAVGPNLDVVRLRHTLEAQQRALGVHNPVQERVQGSSALCWWTGVSCTGELHETPTMTTLLGGVAYDSERDTLSGAQDVAAGHPQTWEGTFWALRFHHDGRIEAYTDLMGNRALFTAERNGQRYVATSAKALAAVVDAPLDIEGVAAFITTGMNLEGLTLWQGVRFVPGGAHVQITGHGLTVQSEVPGTLTSLTRDAAAPREVAHFLRRFATAVASERDEVWCSLTGGRDSRLIAAATAGLGARY